MFFLSSRSSRFSRFVASLTCVCFCMVFVCGDVALAAASSPSASPVKVMLEEKGGTVVMRVTGEGGTRVVDLNSTPNATQLYRRLRSAGLDKETASAVARARIKGKFRGLADLRARVPSVASRFGVEAAEVRAPAGNPEFDSTMRQLNRRISALRSRARDLMGRLLRSGKFSSGREVFEASLKPDAEGELLELRNINDQIRTLRSQKRLMVVKEGKRLHAEVKRYAERIRKAEGFKSLKEVYEASLEAKEGTPLAKLRALNERLRRLRSMYSKIKAESAGRSTASRRSVARRVSSKRGPVPSERGKAEGKAAAGSAVSGKSSAKKGGSGPAAPSSSAGNSSENAGAAGLRGGKKVETAASGRVRGGGSGKSASSFLDVLQGKGGGEGAAPSSDVLARHRNAVNENGSSFLDVLKGKVRGAGSADAAPNPIRPGRIDSASSEAVAEKYFDVLRGRSGASGGKVRDIDVLARHKAASGGGGAFEARMRRLYSDYMKAFDFKKAAQTSRPTAEVSSARPAAGGGGSPASDPAVRFFDKLKKIFSLEGRKAGELDARAAELRSETRVKAKKVVESGKAADSYEAVKLADRALARRSTAAETPGGPAAARAGGGSASSGRSSAGGGVEELASVRAELERVETARTRAAEKVVSRVEDTLKPSSVKTVRTKASEGGTVSASSRTPARSGATRPAASDGAAAARPGNDAPSASSGAPKAPSGSGSARGGVSESAAGAARSEGAASAARAPKGAPPQAGGEVSLAAVKRMKADIMADARAAVKAGRFSSVKEALRSPEFVARRQKVHELQAGLRSGKSSGAASSGKSAASDASAEGAKAGTPEGSVKAGVSGAGANTALKLAEARAAELKAAIQSLENGSSAGGVKGFLSRFTRKPRLKAAKAELAKVEAEIAKMKSDPAYAAEMNRKLAAKNPAQAKLIAAIKKELAKPNLSPSYKKALETRLQQLENTPGHSFTRSAAQIVGISIGTNLLFNIYDQVRNGEKVDLAKAGAFLTNPSFWLGTAGVAVGAYVGQELAMVPMYYLLSTRLAAVSPMLGLAMSIFPAFLGGAIGGQLLGGGLQNADWARLIAQTIGSTLGVALVMAMIPGAGMIMQLAGAMTGGFIAEKLLDLFRGPRSSASGRPDESGAVGGGSAAGEGAKGEVASISSFTSEDVDRTFADMKKAYEAFVKAEESGDFKSAAMWYERYVSFKRTLDGMRKVSYGSAAKGEGAW